MISEKCPICNSILVKIESDIKYCINIKTNIIYNCYKCNYNVKISLDMDNLIVDHTEHIILNNYAVQNLFARNTFKTNQSEIYIKDDASWFECACKLDFCLNFKNLTEEKLKSYLMLT